MNDFSNYISRARSEQRLVVQPRMGFGQVEQMEAGLRAVKDARASTVGTITLDSYTRVGNHEGARSALREGRDLNGFPIVAHGAQRTRSMLASITDSSFPVQVRHGSPLPLQIFHTLIEAGIGATEGGPISYCLPYGRTSLSDAIQEWARCCDLLGEEAERGNTIHLESFGGCMLGQLCPPSMLIAISVLEAIFFKRHGVRSISLSYAQQTNFDQDLESIQVLNKLASEYLGDTDWHVVLYTYMGVFPYTRGGALDLIALSSKLAIASRVSRMIVKTVVEANRIPTISDNIEALEHSDRMSRFVRKDVFALHDSGIETQARSLIGNVLSFGRDIGDAIRQSFIRGYLDIPFCLHADNSGKARSCLDNNGYLQWSTVGNMPLEPYSSQNDKVAALTSDSLLDALSFIQRRFDTPYLSVDKPRVEIESREGLTQIVR